jgi:NAD(P)H-dependent FMN reductase
VKNAIEHLHSEWTRRPIGMVSYGRVSGGTRGVTALRSVTGAVGLVQTLANVELAWVATQIDDESEFGPTDEHILASQLNDLVALDAALRPLRS